MTVTVADTITNRTVTVTYTAASQNFFPTVLGQSTIALKGTSQAVGAYAPNINFYLLLDNSPSMALPATSSGINTMVTNTQYQCDSAPAGGSTCGCAFACHESHPSSETYCNSTKCTLSGTGNPGGEDNYALARALGLTLRIDNLATATANLMSTAQSTETANSAVYQMAIYTFNSGFNTVGAMTKNMTTAASEASTITVEEVYSNNYLTSSTDNSDEDTNFDGAMSSIDGIMPNPGNGTNATGDTPEEVLFIVTDGVIDEAVSSEPAISSSYGAYCCSKRQQSTVNPLNSSGSEPDTDWCTTIKNRGIRIAVLYTTYYALGTSNGWFNTYVAPLIPPATTQDNIGARLESCASPGLYAAVTTDGDISAALSQLFQQVVATSHLTK